MRGRLFVVVIFGFMSCGFIILFSNFPCQPEAMHEFIGGSFAIKLSTNIRLRKPRLPRLDPKCDKKWSRFDRPMK